MKSIFKIFRPFLYLLYWLTFFIRRNPHIWIFGGDYNSFSNGKYLAHYILKNHPEVKPVWVVRSHIDLKKIQRDGFEAYYHWSWNGIKYSLIGKYQFLNSYVFDINYWLSCGSTIINLWHGLPLKKLNFDIEKGPSASLFNPRFLPAWITRIFILRHKSPHYFIATSKVTQEIFSKAFRVPKEKCLITGYPRNDVFFEKNTIRQSSSLEINSIINNAEKTFVYMPTWRDTENDFLVDSEIDINAMNIALSSKNYHMFIKLHPLTKLNSLKSSSQSNIHFLPGQFDVYPYLINIDVLITDYSSIYFDFLLTENIILFFPFDLDKYQSQDRDLYFEYNEVTPGPVANNFSELLELINNRQFDKPLTKAYNYIEIKDRFWNYKDGKSSERIFHHFYENP